MPPAANKSDPVLARLDMLTARVEELVTTQRTMLTAEQLCAVFALDAPVALQRLYGVWGSRSSFSRWKKQGLAVFHVEGIGPAVVPSELRIFLLKKRGSITPDAKGQG